jgi:hypothetical protein
MSRNKGGVPARAHMTIGPGVVLWVVLGMIVSIGCTRAEHAAAPPDAAGTTWLKGATDDQMLAIEKQLRGLDVAMIEIGYRFGELYWAGQDRNWDYAKYQADKVRLALELAVERRPKRAASAQPFLKEDLPAVVAAIDARDPERYQAALERLRTACAKCHVAESVPFFAAQFPERRVSVIRPAE